MNLTPEQIQYREYLRELAKDTEGLLAAPDQLAKTNDNEADARRIQSAIATMTAKPEVARVIQPAVSNPKPSVPEMLERIRKASAENKQFAMVARGVSSDGLENMPEETIRTIYEQLIKLEAKVESKKQN